MDIHTTLYATRGAVTSVAGALRVSVAAVSQWKRRGIPAGRLDAVEAALRAHLDQIGQSDVKPVNAATSNHAPARREAVT